MSLIFGMIGLYIIGVVVLLSSYYSLDSTILELPINPSFYCCSSGLCIYCFLTQ